ncbi:hypothetical protein MMC11_007825 [Xylographa trunciseda]|nr:hypothetical protein [Xylographa trunciseda]
MPGIPFRMDLQFDLFDALGLNPTIHTITLASVHKAWRRVNLHLHPDKILALTYVPDFPTHAQARKARDYLLAEEEGASDAKSRIQTALANGKDDFRSTWNPWATPNTEAVLKPMPNAPSFAYNQDDTGFCQEARGKCCEDNGCPCCHDEWCSCGEKDRPDHGPRMTERKSCHDECCNCAQCYFIKKENEQREKDQRRKDQRDKEQREEAWRKNLEKDLRERDQQDKEQRERDERQNDCHDHSTKPRHDTACTCVLAAGYECTSCLGKRWMRGSPEQRDEKNREKGHHDHDAKPRRDIGCTCGQAAGSECTSCLSKRWMREWREQRDEVNREKGHHDHDAKPGHDAECTCGQAAGYECTSCISKRWVREWREQRGEGNRKS